MASKPSVIIYALPRLQHQIDRAESFKRGLQRHGYNAEVSTYTMQPKTCDVAVFWGMHQSKEIRALQERNGKDWLMMERGYVGDRFNWTAIGYNGLNGRADFLNRDSLGDRWEKFFPDKLKQWHDGDYVLVAAQVMGDASLAPFNGRYDYDRLVNEIRRYTTRPIYFRPHPQRPVACPSNAKIAPHANLEDALANAHCVVTVNSNTSVDAVLAGTRCITLDAGSMAREVTDHSVAAIENLSTPDRIQWAYNIAYAQWSPEEIESGEAWEHLKRRYE